jgi:hypothetical protein
VEARAAFDLKDRVGQPEVLENQRLKYSYLYPSVDIPSLVEALV